MAQVVLINPDDKPPSDQDHVLVEKTPNGKYAANGSVSGERDATFWTPAPYDTPEAALAAAHGWADRNGVRKIYVRGPKAP